MKHARSSWLIGLAALLATSVACERTTPADRTAEQAPTTQTATPDEARTDAGITTAVQARLYSEDAVRGQRIHVSTNNGVVTLQGQVDSESARQEAVRATQAVEGVSRVDDQLQVGTATADARPTAAPDDRRGPADRSGEPGAAERMNAGWITTKIQAQYFVNPEINPFNIDVTTTSDGVVTLRGRVESASDREEAVRIARATEGVVRVEDQLRVGAETVATTGTNEGERSAMPAQPDAWITAKIQSKYFLDDEVKGRRVDVDTKDGVVTLRGTVNSDAQRRQALALARTTDGVIDVRDELTVNPASDADPVPNLPEGTREAGDRARDTAARTGDAIEDTWITTKIQSKFFLDDVVKGSRVNVDTRNGVVTLKGQVESEEARKMAEAIARDTEGVARVVNQLTVGPPSNR